MTSSTTIEPDTRLIDYLGADKVAIMQKNNPSLIHYYNFFLDNSYSIETVPADKLQGNNFEELSLPLSGGEVDTKVLNVLKLNIQRKYDENIYYKIKGSDQIFIMLSEEVFIKKYNKYRKENGLMDQSL
ncbi:MAG: hypothetical protein DRI86_02610 [Bacteroidetes bacterium]|nr:MAG: hypothetical protein DRI86_02610 [Bacteroidota bacterium]